MRLTFQLRFHTDYGQTLWLAGNHEILGGGLPEKAVPLHYLNGDWWQVTLVFPQALAPDAEITYQYILRHPDGSLLYDWANGRTFNPARLPGEEVLILDSWNAPGFYDNAFYTEPFREVLLREQHREEPVPSPAKVTHLFRVKAPLLTHSQTLCLLGSAARLGRWDTTQPVLLQRRAGEDHLTAALDLSQEAFPIAYKYGVYDLDRKEFVRYEEGSNRTLWDHIAPGKQTILNDGFAVLPTTTWKGAGVAIPVFSLRSERSFGVGEFADLKPLVDWCRQTGLKLIQVLPLNDTSATHTWTDSYPYAAISAFALHPIYLNLERLVGRGQRLPTAWEKKRLALNTLETVDYEAVMTAKLEFLREVYPAQREKLFKRREYRNFFETNRHWLVPYAVFCYLRDKFGTVDFNQWPELGAYQAEKVAALAAPGSEAYDQVAFHFFIQYHLHEQLSDATEYAHANGVILKGATPLGVYRYGADAWQAPELYHMDVQAGAPPDAFAIKGQNWGFPTYNWPRMKQTGFAWWKARFGQMGHYFDAFRIDHILGFFRIWSIPMHAVEGILGYFVPALPVQVDEFAARGIAFDRQRYVKPYITEAVLAEIFGGGAEEVKTRFLQADRFGNLSLRPEFATQRQVEKHFAALEQTPANRRLRQGLYDLISNVILLEVEGSQGRQYHFRFAIETTPSYQALEVSTRRQLWELYLDYFYRRQDGFWMKEALEKLPALKRVTNMLICGEDLGMVPGCVPEVMKQLGLLSLEIQRMPKDPRQEFFRPQSAPYLAVVTPSTHDMSTIRGWWEEDRAVTQKFYNHELGQAGEAPKECEAWINRAIVRQHLASPAMWSIFQLQDLLGQDEVLRRNNPADERINVPAIPNYYWRYRMHLTLEQLLQAQAFNSQLKTQVRENGR